MRQSLGDYCQFTFYIHKCFTVTTIMIEDKVKCFTALNREELLIAKKGLVFLHGQKNCQNFEICNLRKEEEGRGGILAQKFC